MPYTGMLRDAAGGGAMLTYGDIDKDIGMLFVHGSAALNLCLRPCRPASHSPALR